MDFKNGLSKKWFEEKLELSHGNHNPLLSMEGLRGVAVFLVFLVHYSSLVKPWITGGAIHVSDFIHNLGNVGVDLFFVLSGYLIYGTVISKPTFSPFNYAKRRIQRIYPTFLFVLTLYLTLSFAFPSESKLPQGLTNCAIYIVQNALLLPGIFNITPIITVAWSLSYEVFYYFIIPVLIPLFRLKAWSPSYRIVFWCVISILAFIIWELKGGPIRLVMFVSGIILFEVHRNKHVSIPRYGTRMLVIALAIFGLRTVIEYSFALSLIAVYVLFLFMCLCAFNSESFLHKWLIFTPLRWLGNMSYSYYLFHGITLKFCFLILAFASPPSMEHSYLYFWLWIPLFIITLCTSFLLFVLIERPLSLAVKK